MESIINRKVLFYAPKKGYAGAGPFNGTVIDKIIVSKKIYEHEETAMHSSYNPKYKETVSVNAYLIQDEDKKTHVVHPEDIRKFFD